MRKVFISTLILLFTATVISYAGNKDNDEISTNNSGFFNETGTDNSTSETAAASAFIQDNGGFFRADPNTDPADPTGGGQRPGDGSGIGQNSPLHDGLHVLIACCVVFILVKFYNEKRKKTDD